MGVVSRLILAKTITLNRMSKNYGWLAFTGDSFRISSIDLIGIMTTAVERHNLLVGHIFYQLKQLWILTKEMLASITTAVVFIIL